MQASALGAGSVDANGKPVFVATERTKYVPTTDRPLTDQEQVAWRVFQLYKATLSLDRRDSVYQAITNNDYTQVRLTQNLIGSPYPMIEHEPGFFDSIRCIRWYEHALSAFAAFGYTYWLKSKASMRYAPMTVFGYSAMTGCTFLCSEGCFVYRSISRLSGYLPNDYEANLYGVIETKDQLERKKNFWAKYAAYKEEWMRRWDYHVYGIRPGERGSLFSACWLSPWPVRYGTKTDYPMRKNPYFLSATPLHDMFLESPFLYPIPMAKNYPLVEQRPEVYHIYRGPENQKKQ